MRGGARAQKDHQPGDILGMTDPQIRRGLRQLLRPALQLHQPAGHLARVEARRDGVAEDVPRAKLDGQVLGQVDDGGLGGRVGVGGVVAEGADADPRHGRGHDDAGGIIDAGVASEQGLELLHGVEDALDVQIHDFLEGRVRVRFESLAPGRARVGEEDVDVVGRPGYLGRQAFDLRHLGRVGRDRDGGRARSFVWEIVERFGCFVAGTRLA
jgi:hypothetical protein